MEQRIHLGDSNVSPGCCAQQTGMHVLVVEALLILQGLSMEGKDIYILLMLTLVCWLRPIASLVTPCLASLAMPWLASLATPCRFINDALLALLGGQPKRGLLTTLVTRELDIFIRPLGSASRCRQSFSSLTLGYMPPGRTGVLSGP